MANSLSKVLRSSGISGQNKCHDDLPGLFIFNMPGLLGDIKSLTKINDQDSRKPKNSNTEKWIIKGKFQVKPQSDELATLCGYLYCL